MVLKLPSFPINGFLQLISLKCEWTSRQRVTINYLFSKTRGITRKIPLTNEINTYNRVSTENLLLFHPQVPWCSIRIPPSSQSFHFLTFPFYPRKDSEWVCGLHNMIQSFQKIAEENHFQDHMVDGNLSCEEKGRY